MIEAILNRLRGTGVIKHFGTLHICNKSVNVNLVWNHVYALYLALIVGYLTMNIYAGIATMIAYFIGESKGWGEWVGTLTSSKELTQADLLRNYKDNEGRGFPYIHKIANLIAPEISTCDDLDVAYQYKCNVPKDGIYEFFVPAAGTISTSSELR